MYFLRERFVNHIPTPAAFYAINGLANPAEECRRLEKAIREAPVDVVCAGVGQNGHLAFNDPPADFNTDAAYLDVGLDAECRRQQLDEGWFPTLEAVPERAISMSIRQILRAGRIVCLAPGERKRTVVKAMVEGPLTPAMPASSLRLHRDCRLLIDEPAAVDLSPLTRASAER